MSAIHANVSLASIRSSKRVVAVAAIWAAVKAVVIIVAPRGGPGT